MKPKKQVLPQTIAWWITPDDKKIDAHGERDHWKVVAEMPKEFHINPNDPVLRNKKEDVANGWHTNAQKLVDEAVRKGAIRLVSVPTGYYIDSTRIDKTTIDRVWTALPNLADKELMWSCKVPFKGHTGWRGKLEDLEIALDNLTESHSLKTCMDCKEPPTKEVLWAEGMGHAWFCDKCFNAWKAKHKGDINSVKDIKNRAASKKFGDNNNPNIAERAVRSDDIFTHEGEGAGTQGIVDFSVANYDFNAHRQSHNPADTVKHDIKEGDEEHPTKLGSGGSLTQETERDLFDSLSLLPGIRENDLFTPPTEEDVRNRRAQKAIEDEALYNEYKVGDKVKLAWLDQFGWSDVGVVTSKAKDYVPGMKHAIYVRFPHPDDKARYTPYTYEEGKPIAANKLVRVSQ